MNETVGSIKEALDKLLNNSGERAISVSKEGDGVYLYSVTLKGIEQQTRF